MQFRTPFRLMTPYVFVPLALCAAVSLGCSSGSKAKSSGKALSATDEQIFIGDTVEKNYDPNVIMKRAEAFFEKEDYPEAIIEYQHFLDLHRVHVLASYAQYKLAESHYKMIRTIDRDIDPIYKALEAFEKLRREFPGSRYETDAVERIQSCHRFIAESYMFVGRFYYRREAYLAAAHRFEAILKQYPDMDIAGDALYHLALTYKEMGADDWAREKLIALAERYPNNSNMGSGRKLLAQLNAKMPAQVLASSDVSTPPAFHGGAVQDHPVSSSSVSSAASQTRHEPSSSPSQSGIPTTLCQFNTWC